MERRVIGTRQVWPKPFTELRVPKIVNLHTDPHEGADHTSNTYWDWMLDHGFLLVSAQASSRRWRELPGIPLSQKPATFGITQVLAKTRAGLPNA